MLIKICEQPHIEGYQGAFYRYTTPSGGASACGIWDNWYQGIGVDGAGDVYMIVWKLRDGYDSQNDPDESSACDWDNPAEIIDLSTGLPVEAKLIW